jgi:NAD-dependent deacetylase
VAPVPARRRYRIDGAPIELGQLCEEGTQLRPDIVWFGEETQFMSEACEYVAAADKVLVVGTSLSVYPAASLVDVARDDADKVLNCLEMDDVPRGFVFHRGPATRVLPASLRDGWPRRADRAGIYTIHAHHRHRADSGFGDPGRHHGVFRARTASRA